MKILNSFIIEIKSQTWHSILNITSDSIIMKCIRSKPKTITPNIFNKHPRKHINFKFSLSSDFIDIGVNLWAQYIQNKPEIAHVVTRQQNTI